MEWCTRYLCEYGFGNGNRFMMCRPSQPYQYDHVTPYGTGLCWLLWSVLAKSHITSGGSDWCHSRDGVVPGRTTMPLLWVPGTPLVPAWLIQSRVGARKTYNMWAGYQSSGSLCLVSSGERWWSDTYLGYMWYTVSRGWHGSIPFLVGPAYYLCRV